MNFPKRFLPLPIFAALIWSGCEPAKPAAVAPPPPKVTVARPIVRNVTQWDEYSGHLEAIETVDVKAQVSGFVESVLFTEGALVHKGDLLLTIDPQIFQAQLDSANAALLEARAKLNVSKATLELAQNDLARAQAAGKSGGVSAGEIDTDKYTVEQDQAILVQNQAAITGAEAAVKSAAQYVDWCKVTAPITGRISNRRITPGNMLNGGAGQNTTVITTITSIDPIFCYVDADEASVLRYQKAARSGGDVASRPASVPCFVGFDNETGFPHMGTIDFFDNAINPNTATRRIRCVIPNPDGTLLPGQKSRLRMAGQEYPAALLVLNDAIGTDQDRKYIYVLHDDKTVERRIVDVGPLTGELRVIRSNLKPDDEVVVNGLGSLAMVRPGGIVDATAVAMPEHSLAATAGTPAPAMAPSGSAPAASASPLAPPEVPGPRQGQHGAPVSVSEGGK